MSKLLCLCGHVIVDQTDHLPYKAEFIADQDGEAFYDRIVRFVVDLIKARELGKQEEFVASQFSEIYPKNLALHSIISDAMAGSHVALSHTMYEYQQCGRLWLQTKPNENEFISYVPETETRGVLKSQHKDTKDPEKAKLDPDFARRVLDFEEPG